MQLSIFFQVVGLEKTWIFRFVHNWNIMNKRYSIVCEKTNIFHRPSIHHHTCYARKSLVQLNVKGFQRILLWFCLVETIFSFGWYFGSRCLFNVLRLLLPNLSSSNLWAVVCPHETTIFHSKSGYFPCEYFSRRQPANSCHSRCVCVLCTCRKVLSLGVKVAQLHRKNERYIMHAICNNKSGSCNRGGRKWGKQGK